MKTVYIAMSTDILHEGHINVINKGAEYGEVIIGLLSDKAISEYKRTPLLSFEERKIIFEKNANLRLFYHEKESLTNYFVFLLLPLCFRSEHIFQGDQHPTDNGC